MLQQKIEDLYSNFIAKRTYTRWLDSEKRRESWEEAVQRYGDYFESRVPASLLDIFLNAIELKKQKQVMGSMRALWSAGPALDENNIAAYGCSFIAMNKKEKFGEMLFVMMHGTGVGFSVERQYITLLPEIPNVFEKIEDKFIIEDSKLGWKQSLDFCIDSLYEGKLPQFDFSLLRPKGARLKTFGGRSSGPEPLKQLLNFVIRIFTNAKGRKLNSLEVHDICTMTGECVVVGGVRRSSCISFSNLSDNRMKHAKDGQFWIDNPQRRMANNSVAYTEKPDSALFMEEWLNLLRSGSGERGIFNTEAAREKADKMKRRRGDIRCNPCQPAFATVLTPEGIKTFGEINVGDIIWSGKKWTPIIKKWYTGNKQVYSYNTTSGSFIGTETHRIVQNGKKIEVKDAVSIDSCVGSLESIDKNYDPKIVMDGLVLGDGSYHKASNNLVYLLIGENDYDYFDSEIKHLILKDRTAAFKCGWEIDTNIVYEELDKTYNREIPLRYYKASRREVCSFLRGLFSANGSIVGDKRITLKQTSLKMIKQVQEMLSYIGIRSYYTTNKSKCVEFENGSYECKQSYDLNITSDRELFYNMIGFLQKYKQEKLKSIIKKVKPTSRKKITYDIMSVDDLGFHDVFDITIEAQEHTYWTGGLLVSNCGEALLFNEEFCNLSEVVVKCDDTIETLKEKIECAVLFGCLQSTLTDFKNISPNWKINCEEERLIGVSLTGVCDSPLFKKVNEKTEKLLRDLRQYAHERAEYFAKELNINVPKQITLTKPSGTISQLCNSSSGIHPRYSDYYIRRVRVNAKDPIAYLLMSKNAPCNPEVGQTWEDYNTLVFEFPMKSPRGSLNRDDFTAIEQLEYWKMFNDNWCDGNPSVTIYVKEDEWVEVGAWVYKHWNSVCGLSFLPFDGSHYPLAPYTEITRDEYHESCKIWKDIEINFDIELNQFEQEDNTIGNQESACVGGACELK